MHSTVIELGEFQTHGQLIVGDPCYQDITSVRHLTVKPGTYRAYIEQQAGWNTALFVIHQDYHTTAASVRDSFHWQRVHDDICVDSGQAGFYDRSVWRNDSAIPSGFRPSLMPQEPWYSLCSEATDSDRRAGVIPGGAVSSSGVGDGEYECKVDRDRQGQVVAAALFFGDVFERDESEANW